VADFEADANLAKTSEALSCAEMMILTLLLLAMFVLFLFSFIAVSVQPSFVLVYHAHLVAARCTKLSQLLHKAPLNSHDTTIQGVLDRLRPGFLVQFAVGFERLLG